MAIETIDRHETGGQTESLSASALRIQRTHIIDQIRGYIDETFHQKGIAGEAETKQLESWIRTQDATEKGVESLKKFYDEFLKKQLYSGRELHREFYSQINTARSGKWISQKSYDKWVERFKDKNTGYKTREAWMTGKFQTYMKGWKACAEKRAALLADPRLDDLLSYNPSFAIIKKDSFLDLHFDERMGLLSDAQAALHASEKITLDLYAKAKKRLTSAVNAGFLGKGKDGMWLERIFKSTADKKKIEAFVNGTRKFSLSDLMLNWRNVKTRFDAVTEKANERGADTAARGFKLVSAMEFLSWDYPKRLSYVAQGEERLGDAKNIENEEPIFLRIRHAIDMKDWGDAGLLITEAKTMNLKTSSWPRLKSMERYVTAQSKGKEDVTALTSATEAKNKLDGLLNRFAKSHSEVHPLVSRLLKSNHANRNIHQFRWVWYNNLWCRTHGPPYLNDDVAREGSSEDNEQLTKYRVKNGLDTGRNDVLDYETADATYFRKQEIARHKATFLHANVNSGGVQAAFAEKMEREQDSQWLYWTTFCPHTNGEPKPESWMREGYIFLTEMRSLTKIIENAGYRYEGSNNGLASRN